MAGSTFVFNNPRVERIVSGLGSMLDYVADLGATILVLLPFDHRALDPTTGHLREFRSFLRAAHQRGQRVLVDAVLGYTSNQHAWFNERACAPRKPPTATFTSGGRMILPPPDSEWAWERTACAYYRHAGAPHEPLLNLGNSPGCKATRLCHGALATPPRTRSRPAAGKLGTIDRWCTTPK